MRPDFPKRQLEAALVHKPCWYTAAGESTGSQFDLFLGGKVRRERPLQNIRLSEEARQYSSEYSLIVSCAWRLDGPDGPITGWREPNEHDGPMVNGLAQLVGESIRSIRVDGPAWDLEIDFTGDKTLRIFCDFTKEAEGESTNWFVLGPAGFQLSVEQGGDWTDHDE
jgi:hypothetical protein